MDAFPKFLRSFGRLALTKTLIAITPQVKTLQSQVIARDAMLEKCRSTIDKQRVFIDKQQAMLVKCRDIMTQQHTELERLNSEWQKLDQLLTEIAQELFTIF